MWKNDAFAHAAVTFIADHVHDEMHLFGKNAQTRRNRIKPRLQFREQTDEFFRREFHRRMVD